MKNERPVVLTVERLDNDTGLYSGSGLVISHMRKMNVPEFLWHCFKKLFTPKRQIDVNSDTMEKAGILGNINIGMEVSSDLWYRLVTGNDAPTTKAWGWLNKYSSVLLSPVPPSSQLP